VAKDSIEEKIMELQEKKVAMSNTIVNTDNSKMFSMGTDRLLDIFTFRSEQENQTTEDSQQSRHNLDAIVERYSEDYASLTVEEFVRNLVNPRDNETSSWFVCLESIFVHSSSLLVSARLEWALAKISVTMIFKAGKMTSIKGKMDIERAPNATQR
jgi:hypothetical protein